MSNKKNEVTGFQKTIFALGTLPTTVLLVAIGSFVSYYYTEYVGIPIATVSLMLLITRIWDGINDLIFGIIVDKTPAIKLGKNKMFLLIGGGLGAVTYYLLFSIPVNSNEIVQLIWMFATYIGVSMGLTILQISNFGLYVKLCSTEKERAKLISLQMFFGSFGGLLPSILLIPMIRLLGQGDDLLGYSNFAGFISIILIICIGLIILIVPERKLKKKDIKKNVSIIESIKVVWANKPALLVSIAFFFVSVISILGVFLTPYFAKYVIGDETFISIYGMIALAGILTAIPLNVKLVEKFGAKKVLMGGIVVQIISKLVLIISLSNMTMILILLYIGSMSSILLTLTLSPLLADAADYGLYKFKVNSAGMIAAVKGGMDKFANAISPAFIGLILSIIGFTSGTGTQTERVVSWIKYLYICGPIVASIFLLLPILFYKLDRKMMEDIHQDVQFLEK